MSARYIMTYIDPTVGRGVCLHSDSPPIMLGQLARTLSGKYECVEIRCGNYYPVRDDRGALLWVQGNWTPRGDNEIVNYTERK